MQSYTNKELVNTDIIIIGAGIVGLATAIKLLEINNTLKLLVLEKESGVAKHQTGNNSGVIHSGIYYKPGSKKALNCRKGYKYLIEFCDKYNVEYDLCGKVIVATDEKELPSLDSIFERGQQNGLENLQKLNQSELKEIEPNVGGIAGIRVPQTGIIDFKKVCKKFAEVIKESGSEILFNEEVKSITINDGKVDVITKNRNFSSREVVSCAGLQSDRITKLTNPDLLMKIIPFRGEFYRLTTEKRSLVKSLIYPVPDPTFPFLGVHFTRMIDGEVEAGPNAVFSFKREGYNKTSFDLKDTIESLTWPGFAKIARTYWKTGMGEFYRSYSKRAFVKALQKLIPSITADDLERGRAGVRAQACTKDGGLFGDFSIIENDRVMHVCNAPSPAATASLAIGEHLADKLLSRLH